MKLHLMRVFASYCNERLDGYEFNIARLFVVTVCCVERDIDILSNVSD